MNNIILNEKEYAEYCLRENTVGDNTFRTLSIIGRYYYYCLGYKRKNIVENLKAFLHSAAEIHTMQQQRWDDAIESIANNVKKFKLYEISGVSIKVGEMEVINSIEKKSLRKLAFTLLCLAKLGNIRNDKNNGWVNNDDKDIFRLARVAGSSFDRDIKMAELNELGLLEFPKRNDNLSVRVTFINDSTDEAMFISDFRELGYEYLKYCGENYIRCAECGVLVHGNKNGDKKYCSKCAVYTPIESKMLKCVDCGTVFKVPSMNNKSNRCPYCYDVYRKAKKIETQRIRRNNAK